MGTAAEYNVIRPKILSAKPLPYLHKLNSLTLVLEDDYTLLQHALRLISQRWRYHLQEMRVIIMLTPRLPMDAKAIQNLVKLGRGSQDGEKMEKNIVNF